jgi:predicted O-methyltransferase YrrM
VWDETLSERARKHLATLGYQDVVTYHVGEAVAILRETTGPFDVVFLDIDKPGYPPALPVIEEKLRRGGLLIADNMLWSGRVYDASESTPSTLAIREATQMLTTSPQWVPMLIPVRDGLMVAMRT